MENPGLAEPPFVLADPTQSRGHGKYLIETDEQILALQAAAQHDAENGISVLAPLEVREFIVSPGDYFTTCRILVTAAGEVVGACLKYSTQPKENPSLVINDRTNQTTGSSLAMKEYFENPQSPFYLASQDITNNRIGAGRHNTIALHGTPVINADETAILEHHGFNTVDPKLPNALLSLASLIGRQYGRYLDIVLGIDLILGADDAWRVLEVNTDPGEGPFNVAELGGSASLEASHRLLRTRALGSIASRIYKHDS